MTGWLVRWRLALRIARRDALRHRARSVLVLLMVGLPVMAVVAADTVYRTSQVSPVEELADTLGAADARITGEARERIHVDPVTGASWHKGAPPADPPWTAAEVADALPDGSRVVEILEGRLGYRTEHGQAPVGGLVRDFADPALRGSLTLDRGRFPTEDGEVAISRAVAERGHDVGDTLELTPDEVPVRVVGVVRPPVGSGEAFLVLPPATADLLDEPRSQFLVTVPGGVGWPMVRELNERGLHVRSLAVAADPPPAEAWLPPEQANVFEVSGSSAGRAVLALVVASVVLEVVLLAGPAFAVGVRRQRRDLALVGAAGGAPADLRRIVLAGGLVLGGSAALLGAVLGVGLARLVVPALQGTWDRAFGPFEVPLADVAATGAVGLLAGLLAAYVPARQAARTDVVDTLAGRRGRVRTSWRSPVLGLVLAAAGLALVVHGAQGAEVGVAAGAVLLVTGLVTASPWLVGLLAPLGPRLPVSGRLAVRDATRNRGRTAPAVAAVMATVAGVTALAIGSQSDSTQAQRDYVPAAPLGTAVISAGGLGEGNWAGVEQLLRDQAPERPVHRIRTVPWENGAMRELAVLRPGCPGAVEDCRWWSEEPVLVNGGFGEVASMDADTARGLTDARVRDAVAQGLAAGQVVVVGDGAVADGSIVLAAVEYEQLTSRADIVGTVAATATLPARHVPLPSAAEMVQLPAIVLVPPELVVRLPLQMETTTMLTGGPADPVTPAQEEELRESLALRSGTAGLSVERGWQDDLAIARWVLFALGGLLVLVATLTATGLALTDARPDFATLAAVGAAPRTRRFVAMGSAAVVGGGGALLGVLAGLGPGIAVAYPLTSTDYGDGAQPLVDVPWLLLGGVAVLVPLLAVAVTGLAVRARLPMASRTT